MLSIGQLLEKGYTLFMKDCHVAVKDSNGRLIAFVKMSKNRMFPLNIQYDAAKCLTAITNNLILEDEGEVPTVLAEDPRVPEEEPQSPVHSFPVFNRRNSPTPGTSSISPEASSSEEPRKMRNLEDLYDATQVVEDTTLFCLSTNNDPHSFNKAIKERKWIKAMDEDIHTIERDIDKIEVHARHDISRLIGEWHGRCYGCSEEERIGLLEIKSSIHPYGFSLIDWVDTSNESISNCCEWGGVECDNTTRRVIELDLRGVRDVSLGDLVLNASLFLPFKELRSLALRSNAIVGCHENQEASHFLFLILHVLWAFSLAYNTTSLARVEVLSSQPRKLERLKCTPLKINLDIKLEISWLKFNY
ncbi:hypothetical protein DKX38_006884 [Salix brachista]|uniref:Leucine-rich repeat-containing N-terminal plant-type domain-containing protein n=1 Tax=Salix brachista TaxID=2182728 RepID=A0A5N5MLF4_9ROSI|nr:hypothetical protein DKX38_006884 [Salix brachista]